MSQTESTLIDMHEARAQLEAKYLQEQYPMFDAYLATFDSVRWRNWFHQRIPAEILPRHKSTLFCTTCLLMAEQCTLIGIPMLREQMLIHIEMTLSPANEQQSRSNLLHLWGQRKEAVAFRLADAVFISSLGLLSVGVSELKLLCSTAAEACVQDWACRETSSQVARNIEIIHDAFGWKCQFFHPSSD